MKKRYKPLIIFNLCLEKKAIFTIFTKTRKKIKIKTEMTRAKLVIQISSQKMLKKVIGQANKIKCITGF
jgi:peptidyl-tRNA hydrolase